MKISIIIPVLNSHELLRRYLLYLEKIGIKEDEEIIIMDDGSDVPLTYSDGKLPVSIYQTHDKRPWTSSLARNIAARQYAKGEYFIMVDLDHVITREIIDMAKTFGGQKIQFEREFAVLTENGEISQDPEVLFEYGYPRKRYEEMGCRKSPHQNMFVMRRDVFLEIGGYREDLVERAYPQGEDRLFKKEWYKWERDGKGKVHDVRPVIYVIPSGYQCEGGDVDSDPKGLFHNLSRKTNRNFKYKDQKNREREQRTSK